MADAVDSLLEGLHERFTANSSPIAGEARESLLVPSSAPSISRARRPGNAPQAAPVSMSLLGSFAMAVLYVWAETKKSQRSFLIGCTTVLLVVFSITLLQNTVVNAPYLFLALSEESVGEYDLVFAPRQTDARSPSFSVNHTDLESKLKDAADVRGLASRWILLAQALSSKDRTLNSSTVVLVMDTAAEKNVGLGRRWRHAAPQGFAAHVSAPLLRYLNVKSGENLTLNVDPISIAHTVSGATQPENEFVRDGLARLQKLALSSSQNSSASFLDGYFKNGGDLSEQIDRLADVLGLDFITKELLKVFLENYLASSDPRAVGRLWKLALPLLEAALTDLGIDANTLLRNATELSDDDIAKLRAALTYSVDLTVDDAIEDSAGKYPTALGNVVIVETDLFETLARHAASSVLARLKAVLETEAKKIPELDAAGIPKRIDKAAETLEQYLHKWEIRHYALLVIAVYSKRLEAFVKTKEGLETDVLAWSNKIVDVLGVNYPVSLTIPLIAALRIVYYLRLFLDQILLIIEIFLVILGMALIYALLIADVDAKVYECGMLRALGMPQFTLVELLGIQSLFFSVPGLLIGYLLSWLVFIPIAVFLTSYTAVTVPWALTMRAILFGFLVGFTMPFIALIGPIQRSLSKSLRDALDLYHSLSSETTVTFVELSKLGLSPLQTIIAVLMISFGVLVYYAIPYAFIFFMWALAFTLFVLILIGLVIGLALLVMTIHPYTQRLMVFLMIWGPDRRSLKPLVLKALYGHGRRNANTSMLFTICIAFIIFCASVFALQTRSIASSAKLGIGADIVVQSFLSKLPLNYEALNTFLSREVHNPRSIVESFSFSSFPMDTLPIVGRNSLSNLADFPRYKVLLVGLDENYLNSTFDQFLDVTEKRTNFAFQSTRHSKPDIVKSLFSDRSPPESVANGTGLFTAARTDASDIVDLSSEEAYERPVDVIMTEALRIPASIDTSSPLELVIDVAVRKVGEFKRTSQFHFLAHARAMVSDFPGFIFSSYQQTAPISFVLVSMKEYERIMKRALTSSYAATGEFDVPTIAPRRALYVRVHEAATVIQREDLVNQLRNFVQDNRVVILNTAEVMASTDNAIFIINIFFLLVSVDIITLCFFLLFVSFTANVSENSWEFGVLRALGMTSKQVIRLYIYEALAIVIASVVLGFIVGDIVSLTLALQTSLFIELPFKFDFPTLLFSFVSLSSIAVAVIGSYIPAKTLLKRRIASALKGGGS